MRPTIRIVGTALAATIGTAIALAAAPAPVSAQTWRDDAAHLGTTARVLIVGTRPEDEDNALIAWLSRGRHIETAFLSLTRGESSPNVLSTERQSSLAVVRTAELLAERARDGAHQYFTRAYDFGSTTSDSLVDVLWPHDSLLKDVVSVVRAFRPHVIISLIPTTGEHDATRRLTARLIAESFDLAADTMRLSANNASRLRGWAVSRLFTRIDSAGQSPSPSNIVSVDVGEFDRSTGRSFAELGAEIRQLQRTQRPANTPSVGPLQRLLRLDSTRVSGETLFGATDTTLARFTAVGAEATAQLDTLREAIASLAVGASSATPETLAANLARVARRTSDVRLAYYCNDVSGVPACVGPRADLAVALTTIRERATRAMLDASGIVITGNTERELVAANDSVGVEAAVYNGGAAPITLRRIAVSGGNVSTLLVRDTSILIPPDSTARWNTKIRIASPAFHWWQRNGMQLPTMLHLFGGSPVNPVRPELIEGEDRIIGSRVEATVALGGVDVPIIERPLLYRSPTMVRGDVRRPLEGVPATSVLLERTAEYERASLPIDRLFRVFIWSAKSTPDSLEVRLSLPKTLKADSAVKTIAVPPFSTRNVFFRLRGTLSASSDSISAEAHSIMPLALGAHPMLSVFSIDGKYGIVTHEYPHIPTQQFIRFSAERVEAVDLRVPPKLKVGLVKGSEDLQTPLTQLQVQGQLLDPALVPFVDLTFYNTILIGGGAMANDALAGAIPSLVAFMKNGGTIVVFPGATGSADVAHSGLLPYPVSFDTIPVRVSDPTAEVKFATPKSALLSWPNTITKKDFEGWDGFRARDVPATFDPHWRTAISTGDPKETPTAATILTARVGKGMIVYCSLTLEQQLTAVNAGAARLF
ncbi:MAG TPA: PIG-L family deacetylase, partial [Gemmatimonadaceae bacterium]